MGRLKCKGKGRLDEAMAELARAQTSLVQAQASLVQAQAALVRAQARSQTTFLAHIAEVDARRIQTDAQIAETNRIDSERFARIMAILMEHGRILRDLPDVICEILAPLKTDNLLRISHEA